MRDSVHRAAEDVYKRQVPDSAAMFDIAYAADGHTLGVSVDIPSGEALYSQGLSEIGRSAINGMTLLINKDAEQDVTPYFLQVSQPVSYTHLDVYKRQVCTRCNVYVVFRPVRFVELSDRSGCKPRRMRAALPLGLLSYGGKAAGTLFSGF